MGAATIVSILNVAIAILGIFGNSIVCLVIAKVPAMRTLTNAFIFNQAVIDFLGSFFIILESIIKIPSTLHPNAVVAVLQCYVWDSSIFLWIFFVASTFNLLLLTAERYVAIVYPFKYLTYFGRKQATFMLVGVWVLAVGYKSHVVAYHHIADGSCQLSVRSKSESQVDGVFTFLLQYMVPLIVMTSCYVHIILKLKKGASVAAQAEPTNSRQGDNSMSGSLLRARRNTLKTLFIVFVTYTICWSPNQIAFFMYNVFGKKLNFQGAFYYISVLMVQLNACANPIIYAFKYKQFQNGLRVLLKPCFPRLTAAQRDEEMISTVTARTQVTAA